MRIRALALLSILPLSLVACGDDDTASRSSAPETAASSEGFNDADVDFAQGMIPHHEQAIEMAEIALERAQSDEVRTIAEEIKAAQDPEIETLTTWLVGWNQPLEGEGGHDMGNMGESEMGMMSDKDMVAMRNASGAEFDRMFLTMMIEHHRGAIAMADTEIEDGENPEAKALARQIVETQQSEIDRMAQLLDNEG